VAACEDGLLLLGLTRVIEVRVVALVVLVVVVAVLVVVVVVLDGVAQWLPSKTDCCYSISQVIIDIRTSSSTSSIGNSSSSTSSSSGSSGRSGPVAACEDGLLLLDTAATIILGY